MVKLKDDVTERLNIRRIKSYHEPATAAVANPVVPVQPVGHLTRART